MIEQVILKEFCGQQSDAVIVKRDNGSVFVYFTHAEGYGRPSMELDKLKELVRRCDNLTKT